MQQVPTWKKVIAFLIDFFASFFVFGYIIGFLTGNATSSGFNLNGLPALLLFVLMIVYFYVMNKWLGGTIGKRLLGIHHTSFMPQTTVPAAQSTPPSTPPTDPTSPQS